MSIFAQATTLQALKNEAVAAWGRRPWRGSADCLFCGAWCLAPVCGPCALALAPGGWACPRCALPTPAGQACGSCIAHPPPFESTVARFEYRFPVDRAIQRFKFAGDLAVGHWLAAELAAAAAGERRPDLLVVPPSASDRLARRGFNPALEVATVVGRRLHIRCDRHAVVRTRATAPQPGLGRQARRANLRGAFACHRNLAGRHVAIVDDVMTTGATVEALARVLRGAGALRISVWAVARTPEARA